MKKSTELGKQINYYVQPQLWLIHKVVYYASKNAFNVGKNNIVGKHPE